MGFTTGEGLASVAPLGLGLPKTKWLCSRAAAAAARRGGRPPRERDSIVDA